MSNPIPSSLSLSVISNGTLADATPVENNFSAGQAAINALITALSGGAAGQSLQAVDGTDVQWAVPSGSVLVKGTKSSNATGSGSTYATGTDILAAALSFTADGTSTYRVRISAGNWASPGTGDSKQLHLNLDGAQGPILATHNTPTGGYAAPLDQSVPITPAAGTHTVNVRIVSGAGSLITIQGGAGTAGQYPPITVTVERVS